MRGHLYNNTFRQFGFLADEANMANSGAGVDMYFHCFVKVCPIADETTCSTKTVTGTAISACPAGVVPATPQRRRRDADADSGAIDLNATVVKVTVILLFY